MKAWLVRERDEFCATVVFADTRGRARVMALRTECCEDCRFSCSEECVCQYCAFNEAIDTLYERK